MAKSDQRSKTKNGMNKTKMTDFSNCEIAEGFKIYFTNG